MRRIHNVSDIDTQRSRASTHSRPLTRGTFLPSRVDQGRQSDQGPVRGNRYGIAQSARAPGWIAVIAHGWGNMAVLIREAREEVETRLLVLRDVRNLMKQRLQELPKHAKEERAHVARVLLK